MKIISPSFSDSQVSKTMSCGFDYLGFPVYTKVKFCNGRSNDYSYTAWVQSSLWCLRKTILSFSHMRNWHVGYFEFPIDSKTCNRNRTVQPCLLSVCTVVLNYNNFLISRKTDSCSIYPALTAIFDNHSTQNWY